MCEGVGCRQQLALHLHLPIHLYASLSDPPATSFHLSICFCLGAQQQCLGLRGHSYMDPCPLGLRFSPLPPLVHWSLEAGRSPPFNQTQVS